MAEVLMYARRGCHLCDEARDVLLALEPELGFRYREVGIEGDERLERAYGLRVPVVLIDGEEAFEYRVDAADLRRRLAAP